MAQTATSNGTSNLRAFSRNGPVLRPCASQLALRLSADQWAIWCALRPREGQCALCHCASPTGDARLADVDRGCTSSVDTKMSQNAAVEPAQGNVLCTEVFAVWVSLFMWEWIFPGVVCMFRAPRFEACFTSGFPAC